MLYFNELGSHPRECNQKSIWVSVWNFFTFGIDELFPYSVGVTTPDLEGVIRGEIGHFCHQTYYFVEIGYAYFLLAPIAIVAAGVLLYRWSVGPHSNDA